MAGNEVAKVVRGTVTGGRDVARGAGRAIGTARHMGGAGNPGLMRLLDVHAASSAGDALVAIGLLAAILFAGTVDDARRRVALFLIVTMVPFAVLAPLLGPLLDRFRSGRRFVLSASLAGRAVLAWIVSLHVDGGLWLYVAAFGVVVLSRIHAVTRGAALARLVPPSGLRLSQAAARAAVFATVAGVGAAVLGGIGAAIGPQWPLRLASLIFLVGSVMALALPPLADTEPPEVLPRPFGLPWRGRIRGADGNWQPVLSGRLIGVALLGSAAMRLLYGFLLLFLAFAIRSGSIGGGLLGVVAGPFVQLVLVAGAFGVGTLAGAAIATGMRASRGLPTTGAILVALAAIWATVRFSFLSILVLCLVTAVASGLARAAVVAAIRQRVPEPHRPDALARVETLLMLVWLAGAAIGLVPYVPARLGIAMATLAALAVMVGSIVAAWRLRTEVGQAATGPGGPVSGVLLRPGPHPAPAAAAAPPVALPAAPPAVVDAAAVPADPRPVDAVALPAETVPAQTPTPATPTAETPTAGRDPAVPPGMHVFRPSPPAPENPPGTTGADGG